MAYQCTECKKTFLNNAFLKRHIMTHTGEKPYVCPFCDKAFALNGNLQSHIKIHTVKKQYKCDVCEIYFKYKEYLETTHIKKCKGKKTRPCSQCDQVFSTRDALKSHMKIHNANAIFPCNYCDKTYSKKCHLTWHIRSHPTSQLPKSDTALLSGDELHKSLGEKEIMKSHQWQCSYCEWTFKHKRSLNKHMMIHTGEKPYKCCYCEKAFRIKYLLTYHMRIHTGEKPHKCSLCEMTFRTKYYLNIHIRKHTGEKPYQCKYCQKAFYSRNSRNKHLRIHTVTGEKTHQCKYCEKSYVWRESLREHLRTHTKEQTQGASLDKMVEFRSYTLKSHTDADQYKSNTYNTSLNSRHRVIFGMAYKAASMAERVKPNSFKTVFNQYLLANNIPIVEPLYSI